MIAFTLESAMKWISKFVLPTTMFVVGAFTGGMISLLADVEEFERLRAISRWRISVRNRNVDVNVFPAGTSSGNNVYGYRIED